MPHGSPDDCLDEQRALDLVDGTLDARQRAEVHAHLVRCPACAALVADLARALGAEGPAGGDDESDAYDQTARPADATTIGYGAGPGATAEPTVVLSAGTRIGPYRILRPLAAGGMGVVYVAEDPRLDRKVALKLLRADMTEPGAADRLRGEAQALARLSSPHVVTVHAAGDSPHGTWVAMELVDGQTLADWLREHGGPGSWRPVLSRFIAAAHGLADAHAAGIVHRDFKPSNVLLGSDGRVLVADFGLAATYDAPTPPSRATDDPTLELGRVTRTGGVVGTPAYMAPEQLAGRPTDARSDQFSLCVALYEGLFGQRPYPGTTLAALGEALEHGRIRRVDPGAVPGWLCRAVGRGLSPDPERRHRDMSALLGALDPRAQQRRRRRRWATGAVLAPLFAVAWAGRAPVEDPCATAAEPIDAVWNEDRRDAIATAFMATGDPGAPTLLAGVSRTLDQRAEGWREATTAACEATQGTESTRHLDQRMQCLQTALFETEATIDSLLEADARTVARSDLALAHMTQVADCEDPAYLDAVIEPPSDPEAATAVELLRRDTARARARLATTHDLDAAVQQFEDLERRADRLGYAPLRASIAVSLGRALYLHGDEREAIARLEPAYFEALQRSDLGTASEAAGQLTMAYGHGLGQLEEALRWSRHAEAAARAVGDPIELATAQLVRGELLYTHQRFEESEHTLMMAWTTVPPGAGLRVRASVAETLGNLHAHRWLPERALPYYEEALRLQEQRVGPDHHDLLRALNGQAICQTQLRRFDEAAATFRRALAIAEAGGSLSAGPAAQLLTNLGALNQQRGQLLRALDQFQEALGRLEDLRGVEHEETMTNLFNVANLLNTLGRHAEALDAVRLFNQRAALRPTMIYGLALRILDVEQDSRRALGQRREAIAAQRRRIQLRHEQTPDDHEAFARDEATLAELEEELAEELRRGGSDDADQVSSSSTSAM